MLPADWIEHRRADDRELLGWIRPAGEEFVAVDRLGREVTGAVDWLAAEEALDERGLRWLAERWSLTLDDGTEQRVRFAEVSPEQVVVVAEQWGAVLPGAPTWTLPFPAPGTLRPFEGDAHVYDA
ncbi:hypothetical protein [Cellulomonas sp. PS-H5]|uniref:hypothetical protein n=1 Tax=Cellulomonas sp. PS-H5 TaxID=2820400 RepID=UPI001C4F0190|nr:hypothetical protein [Cellulomonas sp. PS-H5]MBW0252442.1 hypothetical protein [Cellulomonas sp. PS-H5]